jgi:hypothetical protein
MPSRKLLSSKMNMFSREYTLTVFKSPKSQHLGVMHAKGMRGSMFFISKHTFIHVQTNKGKGSLTYLNIWRTRTDVSLVKDGKMAHIFFSIR